MGAVLSSLNSVKEVIEDIDEASKESSEVTINIPPKLLGDGHILKTYFSFIKRNLKLVQHHGLTLPNLISMLKKLAGL